MAAIFSGLWLVVFIVGIAQASARGIQLECGCFGGGGVTNGSTAYTLDILRDVGLLILAVFLAVWSFTRVSLESYLARNDQVEQPSAKRMRSEQGRRKYNALLEERRKAARERGLWVNASLSAVIILIALIGLGVQSSRAKIAGSLAASHATVSHGVVYGKKAPATVDVYEDFQCPHCLAFEQQVGATMDADVRANKAQVRFHTLAFLDSSSDGNRYSSRAANAALCASDVSVDAFVKYHNKLFTTAVQPTEGTKGRSDTQLESYASVLGLTGSQLTTFDSCVSTEKHKALVQAITDRASKDGINATPTVKVNGKSISPTLAAFNAAIAKAVKNGPAPSPSSSSSAATK
jgi:protein-disulfide isomerase